MICVSGVSRARPGVSDGLSEFQGSSKGLICALGDLREPRFKESVGSQGHFRRAQGFFSDIPGYFMGVSEGLRGVASPSIVQSTLKDIKSTTIDFIHYA